MKIEVAHHLVRFSWGEEAKSVFLPEEDLYLEVFRGEQCVLSRKVTFLEETEEVFPPGDYEAVLWRKKRFALELYAPFHYTPKVVLVSENERRHHLSFADIDWENVRRDVELGLGVRWDRDIEVSLLIKRHPDPLTNFSEEEWQPLGMRDYVLVLGAVKVLELHVTDRKTGESLKKILALRLLPPETVGEVARARFSVPEKVGLFLVRQVVEPDQVNLKAFWEVPGSFWQRVEEEWLRPSGLSWEEAEVRLEILEDAPQLLPGTYHLARAPFPARLEESESAASAARWDFSRQVPAQDAATQPGLLCITAGDNLTDKYP